MLSSFPQELGPLGVSSLESHWGTLSRHPSCQVNQKEVSRGTSCRVSLLRRQLVGGPFLATSVFCGGCQETWVLNPTSGCQQRKAWGSRPAGVGLTHMHACPQTHAPTGAETHSPDRKPFVLMVRNTIHWKGPSDIIQ